MKIPQSIDPKNVNAIVDKWKDILDYSSKDVAEIKTNTFIARLLFLWKTKRWCLEEAGTSAGIFSATTAAGSGPQVQWLMATIMLLEIPSSKNPHSYDRISFPRINLQ